MPNTQSNNFSVIDFKFKDYRAYIIDNIGERIRGFVECIYKGKFTYRIDFKLSGGYFQDWTVIEMAQHSDGIKSLMWVLEKDFPPIIKDHIRKTLKARMQEM
jgi:hypothetical protein